MDLIEFLGSHAFRMVIFGTALIGLVAGDLAAFAYLWKQPLISDVVAHSALLGAPLAFLITVVVSGVNGRKMLGLIVGTVVTGTLAALFANAVAARTKI